MQKLIRILVILSLFAPAFSVSVAAAEHGSSSNSNSGSSQSSSEAEDSSSRGSNSSHSSSESENETETENETEPTTTLEERISEHKSQFKQKLTNAQQLKVKTKCKDAQGLIGSLSVRIKNVQTNRNGVYKNITNKLASLQTKLQQKDIDTTELQAEISVLRTKVDAYKTDTATYKQAVIDLAGMDCTSDPTAFKSTLDAARAARQKVADDIADIRTYVNNTIKPTLVKIRLQLTSTEPKEQQ